MIPEELSYILNSIFILKISMCLWLKKKAKTLQKKIQCILYVHPNLQAQISQAIFV